MEYLSVIITSIVSLFVLFLLTKINGNKQISHLTMFDYIVSISIGSIAAELSTELEKPAKPLIAMVVYAVISFSISYFTEKSVKARRVVFGRSVVLMEKGKLYRKNFKKSRIDISEFLMQARTNGYFDISAIDTAVLEPSGNISFMPLAEKRPATSEDLKVVPQKDNIYFNVISDGQILDLNLQHAGRDRRWLENEMKAQGYKNAQQIFLATLDTDGKLNIFENTDETEKNDFFQ